MDACTVVEASRASLYPPLVARKTPTETDWIENDISQDVDCAGAGVTISTSVWAIDATDDDGALTLGTASFTGLITRQPYSGGTAGISYRIINTVTTSDGRTLEFTAQVTIADTVKAPV